MRKNLKKKFDKDILLQIIEEIVYLENPTAENVAHVIAKHSFEDYKTFSKSQIIEAYNLFKGEINLSSGEEKKLLEAIKMKKIRTESGVAPVAILTKPFPCPGQCIYCPNDLKMPKSYLSREPGAQRASSNEFDPYLQVYNRLVAYKKIGHKTDKVELIVLGGTWSYYPKNYRIWFIKRAFEAMNDFNSEKAEYKRKTRSKDFKEPKEYNILSKEAVKEAYGEEKILWEQLFSAQKKNETADTRCVGLSVETRPDYISRDEVKDLRKLGATKIQLGVQSLRNEILSLNKRGHGVREIKKAFRLLRLAGFKIQVHWMPNLYGSAPVEDVKDFRRLFTNESFRPDELKIYPCSLIANTELFNIFMEGKWEPYTETQLLWVLEQCISFVPRYCRISRVVRDISSGDILIGNKKSNFRQIAEADLERRKVKINDIRYREIKDEKVDFSKLKMRCTPYETTVSSEFFIEYVTSEDKVAAFLRLSLPKKLVFFEEIKDSAMIREVHVYGELVGIGRESENKAQHIGLGSKLIKEAERIAKKNGFGKISVISSIGTREYYAKRGYDLVGLYQVKKL